MYRYRENDDALGFRPEFIGPGLPQYCNEVHVMQPMNEWATKHADDAFAKREANRVLVLLEHAFEAGRKAAFAELCALIGAKIT